jgi:hypothetical protein
MGHRIEYYWTVILARTIAWCGLQLYKRGWDTDDITGESIVRLPEEAWDEPHRIS